MSKTTASNRGTPARKRLSAAERAEVARANEERARIEFETRRPVLWGEFFSIAMRLQLLVRHREFDGLTKAVSWWFDDFEVDAKKQTVSFDGSRGKSIGFEEFTFGVAEFYMNSIKTGLDLAFEFREGRERRLREEQELRDRKNAALAKLSDEERRALSLPASF